MVIQLVARKKKSLWLQE